eukprot:386108_1
MNSLRSLISLKTKVLDNTDIHIKWQGMQLQLHRSAVDLYATKNSPHLQIYKAKKAFAYSSINLLKNHKYNELTRSISTLSLKLNSARSSMANLMLPTEFIDMNLSNIINRKDHLISSFASITNNTIISVTNTTLKSGLYELTDTDTKYDLKENEIDKTYANSKSISADIELKTFPENNFRYMYQIGHGAFGVVNKSFHLNSGQIVAIKQCRSINDNAIKSFQKEIYICNEFIDCPYIINMIDYGSMNSSDNKILIALEYMNMGSLNKNISILQCNNHLERIKHISFYILN